MSPYMTWASPEHGQFIARPVDRRRTLAIGDGVQTDLFGAREQGLDALFIAAGINRDLMFAASETPDMAAIDRLLSEGDASARFAMANLAW